MHLPPLSNRLQACSEFVKQGDRVADIGCDHGYLGIHLLTRGIASFVIAADVNQQPLASAMQNADRFGTKNMMSFHLSDGVQSIPQDFDVMVCAGMGADTMISILDAAPWLKSNKYRLVLQCQSRRPELRKYLHQEGYSIINETLAEDGKFIYTVMEVVYRPSETVAERDYYISPALMQDNHPLLPAFFQRVIDGMKITVDGLSRCGGDKHQHYRNLLDQLLELEDSIHGNCL